MGSLILCHKKRAKRPFEISRVHMRIYTIEELCYYICNNLYLIDYTKVFALGAAKAKDLSAMKLFAGYTHAILDGEMDIHRAYMARLGITPEEAETANVALDYLSYTSYMLRVAYEEGQAEVAAAILSCAVSYEVIAKKIVENHIHAAIFCSPHNPTGRVWEQWEVEKAMEIYQKHDVYVISDEIWSDILLNGHKHVPTQSVSEDARQRTVALYAPSKTFNLAGLIGSYHIIYNDWLRDRILKESSLSHYNSMNLLSMYALIGAYKPEGYEWVDELKEVLSGNINYACDYIEKHFEGIHVSKPEGTYMLFLDCTEWCQKHGKSITELQAAGIEVGVIWQDGVAFHGPCHIRMNLALPFSRVKEAFERLDKYVFN